MKWMDKLKPTKGAAYIKGNALPESDHETATGRALYTITALRKAYDAGFAEGSGSQGFNLCVDGVHIPDDVVKKAVFLYMTRDWRLTAPVQQDVNKQLLEALEYALEWIDAVPKGTVLPTMPGFDRDYVDTLISKAGKHD